MMDGCAKAWVSVCVRVCGRREQVSIGVLWLLVYSHRIVEFVIRCCWFVWSCCDFVEVWTNLQRFVGDVLRKLGPAGGDLQGQGGGD
jgi:hypothetical protein